MGLQVRIILYSEAEKPAFDAAASAFDELARLDDILSDYRPDSELMRLSARSGTGPVRVGPDLFAVLDASQQLAERSRGAFDVTVGPLVRLWRTARREGRLPARSGLEEAQRRVGFRLLRLKDEDSTAVLAVPGMQLDVGGIAKGYAADRALETLRRRGVTRALIEIGGDVRVGDPPPGREGWRIEVANVADEARFIEISNAAVAASGDTEQFVEFAGRRYSHVVDPRTGLGLTSRIAVIVVAPDGLTADGLSTAISILGREQGERLVREHYPHVRAYIRHLEETEDAASMPDPLGRRATRSP